jgi:hypothetical protein
MFVLTVVNFLVQGSYAAPAPSFTFPSTSPINPATNDANARLRNADSEIISQPIRGAPGATILGPQNSALEQQNPDIFSSPKTDHGQVPNVKWPFSLSHNRISTGGWAREQNSTPMHLIISGCILTHG